MSSATVYWRPGCVFCRKLRLGLWLTRTPHRLVDVREDATGSAFVRLHNGGDELVPTVAVGDRVLSNPSVRQVRRTLAEHSSNPGASDAGPSGRRLWKE